MLLSAFQKITFFSCLVLCVALFLPKLFISSRKQLVLQSEVGPGNFPPSRYSHPFSKEHEQWQAESLNSKPYSSEAISRSKKERKRNLISQIIPVYGFGIFLYIIYIFVKLTCNDRLPKQERRVSFSVPECTTQEISGYEMVQLQSRQKQGHGVRARSALKTVQKPASYRSRKHGCQQKQRKLQQLREIMHAMVEGRSLEGVSPEVEAEETPYCADWEGYTEETYPQHEVLLHRHHYPNVILEEPHVDVPSPEELAERMEREVEEEEDKDVEEMSNESDEGDVVTVENSAAELKLAKDEDDEEAESGVEEDAPEVEITQDENDSDDEDDDYQEDPENNEEEEVGEDHPCLLQNMDAKEEGQKSLGNKRETEPPSRRRHITFSNHKHVFHYPKGGAVGCSFEDEEVEEDTNDDDDDDSNDDDNNLEKELYGYKYYEQLQQREEVDPLMEAESLDFNTQFTCDPEEQEVDLIDFLHTYTLEAVINSNQEYQKTHDQGPTGCTTRNRKRKTD